MVQLIGLVFWTLYKKEVLRFNSLDSNSFIPNNHLIVIFFGFISCNRIRKIRYAWISIYCFSRAWIDCYANNSTSFFSFFIIFYDLEKFKEILWIFLCPTFSWRGYYCSNIGSYNEKFYDWNCFNFYILFFGRYRN